MKKTKALLLVVTILLSACMNKKPNLIKVSANIETESVKSSGDAADDPALWINPIDADKSLVFGSNKKQGIYSYDLNGNLKQYEPLGRINNIDIRQDMLINDKPIDLISGTNRTTNKIEILELNDGVMKPYQINIPKSQLAEVYGFCMGYIQNTHIIFVAVGINGNAEIYKLEHNTKNKSLKLLRTLAIDSKSEGCVIDDKTGEIFIAEEEVGIWRFNFFNNEKNKVVSIENEHVTADIEGLALFNWNGAQYLIASSQGSNTYPIFDRKNYSFVKAVRVINDKNMDGTTKTDGIEFSTKLHTKTFPHGVFVVQDDKNTKPKGNQNFKLISAEKIFKQLK